MKRNEKKTSSPKAGPSSSKDTESPKKKHAKLDGNEGKTAENEDKSAVKSPRKLRIIAQDTSEDIDVISIDDPDEIVVDDGVKGPSKAKASPSKTKQGPSQPQKGQSPSKPTKSDTNNSSSTADASTNQDNDDLDAPLHLSHLFEELVDQEIAHEEVVVDEEPSKEERKRLRRRSKQAALMYLKSKQVEKILKQIGDGEIPNVTAEEIEKEGLFYPTNQGGLGLYYKGCSFYYNPDKQRLKKFRCTSRKCNQRIEVDLDTNEVTQDTKHVNHEPNQKECLALAVKSFYIHIGKMRDDLNSNLLMDQLYTWAESLNIKEQLPLRASILKVFRRKSIEDGAPKREVKPKIIRDPDDDYEENFDGPAYLRSEQVVEIVNDILVDKIPNITLEEVEKNGLFYPTSSDGLGFYWKGCNFYFAPDRQRHRKFRCAMRECSQRLDVSLKTGKVYSEVDHRNHLPSPETCLVAAIKNYYNLAMKKKPDSNIANVKTQLITLAQNLNIVQFLPNEAHISRAFRKNKNRCEVKVKEEETADLLDLEQVSSRGVLFSNGDYGETKFLQYDSKKDNEYSELTTRCLIYYDSQILEHTAYFDSYACDLSFTAVPKQFKKLWTILAQFPNGSYLPIAYVLLEEPSLPEYLRALNHIPIQSIPQTLLCDFDEDQRSAFIVKFGPHIGILSSTYFMADAIQKNLMASGITKENLRDETLKDYMRMLLALQYVDPKIREDEERSSELENLYFLIRMNAENLNEEILQKFRTFLTKYFFCKFIGGTQNGVSVNNSIPHHTWNFHESFMAEPYRPNNIDNYNMKLKIDLGNTPIFNKFIHELAKEQTRKCEKIAKIMDVTQNYKYEDPLIKMDMSIKEVLVEYEAVEVPNDIDRLALLQHLSQRLYHFRNSQTRKRLAHQTVYVEVPHEQDEIIIP